MNNNYNPYTVPENFFEDTRNKAISGYRRRRHAFRCAIAAAVVAAVVALPAFIRLADRQKQEQEVVADNLARMYDYDIFLQVSF